MTKPKSLCESFVLPEITGDSPFDSTIQQRVTKLYPQAKIIAYEEAAGGQGQVFPRCRCGAFTGKDCSLPASQRPQNCQPRLG